MVILGLAIFFPGCGSSSSSGGGVSPTPTPSPTSSPTSTTYLYVADMGDDTVSIINIASQALEATVNVNTMPQDLALSKDGQYLYVLCHAGGTIDVIRLSDNTVVSSNTIQNNWRRYALNRGTGSFLYPGFS
ncbi:MAG: YncE family protein [Vulcanimicrobiota bacterium]